MNEENSSLKKILSSDCSVVIENDERLLLAGPSKPTKSALRILNAYMQGNKTIIQIIDKLSKKIILSFDNSEVSKIYSTFVKEGKQTIVINPKNKPESEIKIMISNTLPTLLQRLESSLIGSKVHQNLKNSENNWKIGELRERKEIDRTISNINDDQDQKNMKKLKTKIKITDPHILRLIEKQAKKKLMNQKVIENKCNVATNEIKLQTTLKKKRDKMKIVSITNCLLDIIMSFLDKETLKIFPIICSKFKIVYDNSKIELNIDYASLELVEKLITRFNRIRRLRLRKHLKF